MKMYEILKLDKKLVSSGSGGQTYSHGSKTEMEPL